jgi:hypothetical protein
MIFFGGVTGLGLSWLAAPRFSSEAGDMEKNASFLLRPTQHQ